jgi:hypothetical protein
MTRNTAHEQAVSMRAGMDLARSRRLARQIAEIRTDAGRAFAKNATIGTALLFGAILALDSNAEAVAAAWGERAEGPLFAGAAPDRPAPAAATPVRAALEAASVVETAARTAPAPAEPCDAVLGDKVTTLSLASDGEAGKRAALDMVQYALACPTASVTTSGSLELFELGIADLEVRWTPMSNHLALSLVDGGASDATGVAAQIIGDSVVVNIR